MSYRLSSGVIRPRLCLVTQRAVRGAKCVRSASFLASATRTANLGSAVGSSRLQQHLRPALYQVSSGTAILRQSLRSLASQPSSPIKAATPAAVAPTLSASASPGTADKEPKESRFSRIREYMELSKFRLNSLVVFTAGSGYLMTGGVDFNWPTLLAVCTGTLSCAFSASAINQLQERKYDEVMIRTRQRPLVTGAISVPAAVTYAAATGLGGLGLLYTATNPLTAGLGLATILLYNGVYTPMKRWSKYNTEVGAIVGAIPPIMGWTAAGANLIAPEALILGSYLFCWQMQHFMAVCWMNKADYANAGYVMRSLHDPTGKATALHGLKYIILASALPLIGYFYNVLTIHGLGVAEAVNVLFGLLYWGTFYRNPKLAGMAFRWGFLYIILFLGATALYISGDPRWPGATFLRKAARELCAWVFVHKDKEDKSASSSTGKDKPKKEIAAVSASVAASSPKDTHAPVHAATATTVVPKASPSHAPAPAVVDALHSPAKSKPVAAVAVSAPAEPAVATKPAQDKPATPKATKPKAQPKTEESHAPKKQQE